MKRYRRGFLAGAAAAASATAYLRFPAGAAEFSFKLGSAVPKAHPAAVRAGEAADKIERQSGGRLHVDIFPNNALGSDASMLSQVRIGALEFYLANDSVLTATVPGVGLTSIPFAFASHQDAWTALDGALGRYKRDAILRANLNIYPLEKSWDSGFRQISNYVRPIATPADIKGLKIRIPPSAMTVDAFKALGAIPTAIEGNEIYMALQTHLVDGGDITLISAETSKFYEVQKYISITNHLLAGQTLLANSNAWLRLPRDLRDIVERNFDAAAGLDRADMTRLDDTLRTTLQGRGMIFNQADVASFRATLRAAGLYAKWSDQLGSQGWNALEQAVGKLR